MTQREFTHILGSINGLSPEQMRNSPRTGQQDCSIRKRRPAEASAGAVRITATELSPAPKTILEMVDELRKKVPPEEFSKLPTDGAAQLDHYIYGTRKRPTA